MSEVLTYSATLRAYQYNGGGSRSFLQVGAGVLASAYNGLTVDQRTDACYVGLMVLPEAAKTELKGKLIQNIRLSFTASTAGVSNKKIAVYSCLRDSLDTTFGRNYPGERLGVMSGRFYDGVTRIDMNDAENPGLFENLKAWLTGDADGRNIVVLNTSGIPDARWDNTAKYSANFTQITAVAMTVTYEEGTVRYGVDGEWKECRAFYGVGGEWVPVRLQFGEGGEWKE